MSVTWYEKIANSRPPDFAVYGGLQTVYMERWWVIPRNRFFNIYLHRFWRSDEDEAMHDHPWINFSYLLKGWYIEYTRAGPKIMFTGDYKMRMAHTPHRIEINETQQGKVWSLFITGPVIREWGFHCPKGWRHWRVFTDGKKGTKGIGCS